MKSVQLFCWHFMAYPYLAKDFDEKEYTGWVTVPNSLWDNNKARGLYQEYIDQLVYASELGFDGMVLNEHHQNIYGLMPSPNLIAAALTQKTTRGKIVILGNLLPLYLNPLRVAEEYAMLDNLSDGRLVAGFAPGSGPVRQDPGRARRQLRPVPHGHSALRLCRRDGCAGARRSQGRRLVFPQELPQGSPSPRRPPAHFRAGHPLHSAGRFPQLSEV